MVSSATVRTEYTVSASIEGKSNFSDNNSSHPSENLFSMNSHLTTPKNSYIPNIFITTPTNLSIINDNNESSTNDPNDTIDSPTTNTIKGRFYIKIPDLLKLYNPSTCFNKFLTFYNLQLLPSPQSIGSFLEFIQNEHPEYYSEQYIKISIRKSNNNTHEAHIYLPQEINSLSNSTYIPFENLSNYQNISLKTNLSLTKFKIPSLPECQNLLSTTIFPASEPPITTTYTNNNTLSLDNSNTTKSIKIHSLNVNGLLDSFKQLSLIDYISEIK